MVNVVESVRNELLKNNIRLNTEKIRKICLIVYGDTIKTLREIGMLDMSCVPMDYEMVLDELL